MKEYKKRINFLLSSYVLALFLFTLARILFFAFNKNNFQNAGETKIVNAFVHGIRFDIVSATIINALFILWLAFPVSLVHQKKARNFLKVLFIISNSLALAANMIDLAYFPYTLRRSTLETFRFFFQKNEAGTLLPLFLKDFWYLVVLFFALVYVIIKRYAILEKKLIPAEKENAKHNMFLKVVSFILISGLGILGIRGGTQLIPLNTIDAGEGVEPSLIPVVLNTPFCLVKSGELHTMKEKNYMTEDRAKQLFNPVKKYNFADADFKSMNVVVIILESFSKEFTGLGKRKSFTPFLDSLMQNSFVYTNAFANGKRSIEGIPAILASIPSFENDFISTVYNNNRIMSLASILKEKGYHSSFFHGGTNGTMNFTGFCANAGFDLYFGRKEYNDEKDYDGDWGIWDEPFLQRWCKELSTYKQPFISSVFTLSSHHPYKVPEKYRNKFAEGKLPVEKVIGYTDYSLREFFSSAKKTKWYQNTLFVVTADHTSVSADSFYSNSCGIYEIPIFFFMPGNSLKGVDNKVAQQTDIMPTLLYGLKYNGAFFSFGNNLQDSSGGRFAVNFSNNTFQYFNTSEMFHFDNDKLKGVFNYRIDSLFTANLLPYKNWDIDTLKAFIQQYNKALIENKMLAGH